MQSKMKCDGKCNRTHNRNGFKVTRIHYTFRSWSRGPEPTTVCNITEATIVDTCKYFILVSFNKSIDICTVKQRLLFQLKCQFIRHSLRSEMSKFQNFIYIFHSFPDISIQLKAFILITDIKIEASLHIQVIKTLKTSKNLHPRLIVGLNVSLILQ